MITSTSTAPSLPPPPPPPSPARSRHLGLALGLGLGAAALVVGGIAVAAGHSDRNDDPIRIEFSYEIVDEDCYDPGYADLDTGVEIQVTDGEGTLLGTG